MCGKAGIAPCGHAGEHVIGNYVRCLSGCDAVTKKEEPKQKTNYGTLLNITRR